MKKYDKLIRDKIPEIIAAAGKEYEIETLPEPEYLDALKGKLQEELDEYLESGEVEELADLLEVIYAILDYEGVTREELEAIRQKKRDERGGFSKRLLLIEAEE